MKPDLLDDNLVATSTSHWDGATIEHINDHKQRINENLTHLKRGRLILWGLAALSGLGILVGSYLNPYGASLTEILIEGLFLTAVFAFSAVFFNTNPLVAVIVGFSVYLLNMFFAALLLPESLTRGMILKLIIILGLGRATYAALDTHRSVGILKQMGVPKAELKRFYTQLKPIPLTFNPPERDNG